VLITTHYMDEADVLCARLAIIDHGRIQALDSRQNLKRDPGDTVVHVTGPDLTADTLAGDPGVESVEAEGEHGVLVELARDLEDLPDFLRSVDAITDLEVPPRPCKTYPSR
jgi:ABC-2 type transport system ATP-binding protein